MPAPILSQPKSNPLAAPQPSLTGTMTTPQMPPTVDVGGVAMPPDFAAILGQQEQQPVPYQEAPGAMDQVLAALGGLLSGNPGAIFTNIMETRAKASEVEASNRQAMQENARARTQLMMAGAKQRRLDEEKTVEEALDELKRAGDIEEFNRRKAAFEAEKDKRDIENQRDLLRLEKGFFQLEQAKKLSQGASDEAREAVAYAADQMPLIARQLDRQLRTGADQPILREVNPDTNEIEEIVGIEAIQAYIDNQLAALSTQLTVEDAIPLIDAVDSAYEQILEPLLTEWASRTSKTRVERAKVTREKARGEAERYKRESMKGSSRTSKPTKSTTKSTVSKSTYKPFM